MTETTNIILREYQVRKNKKQKTAFIGFVEDFCNRIGYSCAVEKSIMNRNIVIGSPDSAKIVVTAHYDTCAVLPFPNFITPKIFRFLFFIIS